MAIKINGATVISDSQAFTSTSTVSASGNITGGNLVTGGTISATGNITGGNILGNVVSTGPISTTGNVTGGNVLTGGIVSATGNVQAGNVGTTGIISATGNITGGNVSATNLTGTLLTAAQTNITSVGTLTSLSVTGTVTGGNVATAGTVSATGNITGGNLLINGSAQITGNLLVQGTETIFNVANLTVNDKDIIVANNVTGGANVDGSGIQAGNPATATWFFNNATTSWQSNIGITPTTNGTLSLGGASNYWGTAFVTTASVTGNVQAGNLRTTGLISATGAITGAAISGSSLSVSGNVDGGNIRTAGLISATGAITGAAITGSSLTVSTGNITAGNIVNGNANGVGNIGSSTTYFNTVFAKATSAQYADLAEKYTADDDYVPGTVVMFGGAEEVTVCTADGCSRVAGVISTNPSYIMNGTLQSAHVATVALTGRVPTKVTGTVRKGDLMVSAGNGTARAEADPKVGTVIGKALADFDGAQGVIEVVVGRF